MRIQDQTKHAAPGISEVLLKRNALGGVGHALVLSIRQRDPVLDSYDKDDALAILEGIRCFFELAREDLGDSRCLIEVLVELFDSAMGLCDMHPGLWSCALDMSQLGVSSHEDGVPF